MFPIASILRRRGALALALVLVTGVFGAAAAGVRPDFSVENMFPTADVSRVDYDRFKLDFPLEDARAILIVEAKDIYQPSGLARIAAMENDLARVPGVLDTQSLVSVKDLSSDGLTLKMEKLIPDGQHDAETLAKAKQIATTDPLFHHNLATPGRAATAINVTLTKEIAGRDDTRNEFFHAATEVVEKHRALAAAAGVEQRLTLNGMPVIRSEFTWLIIKDLVTLFPIAQVVICILLFVAFRRWTDVLAAMATIYVSIIWTVGVMGFAGVGMEVLTQITPIVVMIISISDTVHVVTHARELMNQGVDKTEAVIRSASDNWLPCLLTEVTIAFGFLALIANDMNMIQQFGWVTAAGMLLTWLANFTVLPLLLIALPAGKPVVAVTHEGRPLARFIGWVEKVVTLKPRRVVAVAAALALGFGLLGLGVGKEYYPFGDLRPSQRLYHDLRRSEALIGGVVPMSILVETREKKPDAMLEPEALALIDRITQKLETEYGDDVKNAASISKIMRKAHRLLAGEEIARDEPLPATRRLAVQELLAVDDPRMLRDVINFDRSTASIYAMLPDHGSSKSTVMLDKLRAYLAEEERATGYRLTVTGVYGVAEGIYRGMVGGLSVSLALAVLGSFAMFFVVLRSWRLALIALVPNLLPLLVTIGTMALFGIDIKPTTVMVFSITLVIADDDTIQFLSRFRTRFLSLRGDPDPHRTAVLGTLRESGMPMVITTLAVTLGFLDLLFSQFLGLANLGLLLGVSLLSAVAADLFLTPIMIMAIKPKIGADEPARAAEQARAEAA
jgi:predicted RND superfamily exporter protein